MKTSKLQNALLQAVEADNLNKVKALLRQRAKPNFPPASKTTPLLEAVRNGNLDIVKALVNAGADVNGTNVQGDSPLECARDYGHSAVARYLRGKGAQLSSGVFSRSFNSVSRKAIKSGAARATRKTISHKASGGGAKGGSKKPARFYEDDEDRDDNWPNWFEDDETSFAKKSQPRKKAGAEPVNADDGKPVFTAENLKDIFNAAKWVGKTQDMAKLWEDVPARLKKKFDFETAYTDAHQGTLRQAHPPKLQLPSKKRPAHPPLPPQDGAKSPAPKRPDAP